MAKTKKDLRVSSGKLHSLFLYNGISVQKRILIIVNNVNCVCFLCTSLRLSISYKVFCIISHINFNFRFNYSVKDISLHKE